MKTNHCYLGDNRATMKQLIADGVKVQSCVTSPPYFGLRSYLPDGHPDKALEIGLEQTPEAFVAAMVEVFRLVRELLADDGTLWMNMGDSYASTGTTRWPNTGDGYGNGYGKHGAWHGGEHLRPSAPECKPKDMIGIPWMLAFALRADGWYLRQDIIWHKPNPMPESVRDRCTKAHEYLFLLSKSARYYFDQDAIKEPAVYGREPRGVGFGHGMDAAARGRGRVRESKARGEFNGKTNQLEGREAFRAIKDFRNKRSVWTIATESYDDAHFATFPQELAENCILAGTRAGDVVFDPFLGSGTTAQVAQRLGRRWIGCELNADYLPMQERRTRQGGLELGAIA